VVLSLKSSLLPVFFPTRMADHSLFFLAAHFETFFIMITKVVDNLKCRSLVSRTTWDSHMGNIILIGIKKGTTFSIVVFPIPWRGNL